MQSENIVELATALNKVQSELLGAKKDSDNPFFKSKYADLASVWDACREPLTKNGLSVTQIFDGANLITILLHISGQWIKGSIPIIAAKQDPQGIGSAISYYRRYSLAAIVGIVQIDDDAESAMERPTTPKSFNKPTPIVFRIVDDVPPPEGIKPRLDMGKEFPPEGNKDAPYAKYRIQKLGTKTQTWVGKELNEIHLDDLRKQYDGIVAWFEKQGKAPYGLFKEDIEAIEIYLGITKS